MPATNRGRGGSDYYSRPRERDDTAPHPARESGGQRRDYDDRQPRNESASERDWRRGSGMDRWSGERGAGYQARHSREMNQNRDRNEPRDSDRYRYGGGGGQGGQQRYGLRSGLGRSGNIEDNDRSYRGNRDEHGGSEERRGPALQRDRLHLEEREDRLERTGEDYGFEYEGGAYVEDEDQGQEYDDDGDEGSEGGWSASEESATGRGRRSEMRGAAGTRAAPSEKARRPAASGKGTRKAAGAAAGSGKRKAAARGRSKSAGEDRTQAASARTARGMRTSAKTGKSATSRKKPAPRGRGR